MQGAECHSLGAGAAVAVHHIEPRGVLVAGPPRHRRWRRQVGDHARRRLVHPRDHRIADCVRAGILEQRAELPGRRRDRLAACASAPQGPELGRTMDLDAVRAAHAG